MVFLSESVEDTYKIASDIARTLEGGEIIVLDGELGAGKTTFTKGLAAALGVVGEVASPTFVLLREYIGRLPLYHFDLYRLADSREATELGFEEYLYGEGVCVIEWNKFTSFPSRPITIKLERVADNVRRIEVI